jgi:hypothetical protein
MIAVMKTSLIVFTGLGLTWAAGQVSDAVLNPASAKVVLAQADNPADSPADQADSTPPDAIDTPEIEQLTEEELDAELARIEDAAGLENEELEEFVPSKPLAADIPISLPSDI